jgi:hypothetical protein
MKVLNPEAPAYVPGCAVAGKAGSVISDISAASAALAVKPAIAKLVIATTSDAADAALSTPNGLAELATCLSDNLTFEDMFDHGSRRGSVSMGSIVPERAVDVKLGCSSMQRAAAVPDTWLLPLWQQRQQWPACCMFNNDILHRPC